MDIAKNEVAAVLEIANRGNEPLTELNELELTMVGGGCGEVLFG